MAHAPSVYPSAGYVTRCICIGRIYSGIYVFLEDARYITYIISSGSYMRIIIPAISALPDTGICRRDLYNYSAPEGDRRGVRGRQQEVLTTTIYIPIVPSGWD